MKYKITFGVSTFKPIVGGLVGTVAECHGEKIEFDSRLEVTKCGCGFSSMIDI